ncbi:hypothetical protein HK099_008123 [Clydaea vesicula]|uniref:Cyclic nucleotide-binding domain-containing protein n=1 Tax=Clydaea vesicula TaxID=447962 RepID=A0AAD5U531_9FUNG|nr:hypothetical protein HK099_008123 [Clydaea vesicula]
MQNTSKTRSEEVTVDETLNLTVEELKAKLFEVTKERNELKERVNKLENLILKQSKESNKYSSDKLQSAVGYYEEISSKLQEHINSSYSQLQNVVDLTNLAKQNISNFAAELMHSNNSDFGVDLQKQSESFSNLAQERSSRLLKKNAGKKIKLCEISIFRTFPLFAQFSNEVLEKLKIFSYELHRNASDVILSEGDTSQEIFFILEGSVSILNGKGQEISSLCNGSFFGELGFLFNCKRTASVYAKTDCILIIVTIQKLREAITDYPEFLEKLQQFEKSRGEWFMKQDFTLNNDFGGEFMNSIARSNFKKMSIFNDADDSFIESLAMTVQGEVFQADEYIINIGDDATSMYFIMKGAVQVVGHTGLIHAELTSGSSFGEVGILFKVKRTASIRAKEACILFKLTKSSLELVIKDYPNIQMKINAQAEERHHLYLDRMKEKQNNVELFDIETAEHYLKKMSLFSSFEGSILTAIAMELTRTDQPAGKNIITVGERADSMFFLAVGTVDIISEFGQLVDQAQGPSSWFGEVAILQEVPRIATIKTTSPCSIFELKKSNLVQMMEKYPSVKEKIEETAKERLQAHLMRTILA